MIKIINEQGYFDDDGYYIDDNGFNGKGAKPIKLNDYYRNRTYYTTQSEINKLHDDHDAYIWVTTAKGNIEDGRIQFGGTIRISDIDKDWLKRHGFELNESYRKKNIAKTKIKAYEGHTEDGYMGATKWVGDKSNQHLYGKDLSSAIRQDLKDNGITGCTVRSGRATYTTTITVTVKGTPNDKLTYDEFLKTDWEDAAFGYNGRFWFKDGYLEYVDYLNYDEETQKEISRKIYDIMIEKEKTFNINHHYIDKSYNSVFTQQFIKKLQKINSIIEEFRYDDSNGMVDYFDTNFYYDIVAVFQ